MDKKVKDVKKTNDGKIVRALFEERKRRKKEREKAKKLKISDIKHGEGAHVGHLLRHLKAKEVELTFCGVVVVLTIVLVSLYFVFSSVREPVSFNTIQVGNFDVTYIDRGDLLGNIVNLTSSDIMSKKDGMKSEVYKLEVVNNDKEANGFQIKFVNDVAMIREDKCSKKQIPLAYIYYQVDGGKVRKLDDTKRSPIVYQGVLGGEEKETIKIRFWVDKKLPKEYYSYHLHRKLTFKSVVA